MAVQAMYALKPTPFFLRGSFMLWEVTTSHKLET